MHCSNCGTLLTQNLNYCQHCGSRNKTRALVTSSSPTNLLIAAGGAIGVFGLICFFPILRELLRSSLAPPAVVMILIAYLVTVLVMFGVLIGQAWKSGARIHANERPDDDVYVAPSRIRSVNTAQLEAAHGMPASVTEHTTRTLDEMPIPRR